MSLVYLLVSGSKENAQRQTETEKDRRGRKIEKNARWGLVKKMPTLSWKSSPRTKLEQFEETNQQILIQRINLWVHVDCIGLNCVPSNLCLMLLLNFVVVADSFATPWTVACQAPVHGISQGRILELPFPPSGDLPNLGTKPRSPALQVNFLPSGKPH